MTYFYEAKQYSRGKLTIMAVATLMVSWFHSAVRVPEDSLLWLTKLFGDMGVDMFMLASGMGVYLSLERSSEFKSFMVKRLQRVLPVFLLATIPWFICREFCWGGGRDWSQVFWNASTLSYWFGSNLTCWYVSSILLLYALTPGYLKLWKKHPRLNVIAIVCAYLFGYVGMMQLGWLAHLGLLIVRIPVYLMGLYLGKAVKEERVFRIRLHWAVAVAIAMIAVVVITMRHGTRLFPGTLKYYAYGPLAVLLSFLISYLPAGKVMGFFGRRSLEIYLLYEKVLEIMSNTRIFWGLCSDTNTLFALVGFAITLVGAEILARLGWLVLKLPILFRWLDKCRRAQ